MKGDADDAVDAAAGYDGRYYNLRSTNGGAGAGGRGGGGGGAASCLDSACQQRGPRPPAALASLPLPLRAPLGRLVLSLALVATLVLSLGVSGMYVNIRMLTRQLTGLSAAVDGTESKMAEVKQRQEALAERLYDHVNLAEVKLRHEFEKLLRREMWLRDNDKTGLVDFALESAGGRVVSTGTTPRYDAGEATLSFLGIPLYQFARTNPGAMLQPDMSPGECWAFRGSRGVAVVALLGYVHLSAVSLEHIAASQVPTGLAQSAPQDITIMALSGPDLDKQAIEVARFVYKIDGLPLQTFRIPVRPSRSFRYVALRIDSNHGHPDFTCVYRFRVHGSLDHREHHRDRDDLIEHDSTTEVHETSWRNRH